MISLKKISLELLTPWSWVRTILNPTYALHILEVHISAIDVMCPDEDQTTPSFFEKYRSDFADMGDLVSSGKVKELILCVTRDILDNDLTEKDFEAAAIQYLRTDPTKRNIIFEWCL